MTYPKVVLVGRTNVGKSAIFNRISSQTKSIVFDQSGVTRDYLHEAITWDDKKFDFVDAGGFTFSKGDKKDPFADVVAQKIEDLISHASILLFVCDVKSGLTAEDQRIAKLLHKTKKTVYLVVNKTDNKNAYESNFGEFYSLGFNKIFEVSALHGVGFGNLLDAIVENLKTEKEEENNEIDYKVVLLGKPNVGKSSLMNLLIKQERSIISPIPGTTRESISETISFDHATLEVTDTAGIRRRKSIDDNLEELMVKSSFSSVRAADIVVLVVDASSELLSSQELNLLFYAYEQKKCLLVVFNKIDLFEECNDGYKKDRLKYDLEKYKFILSKIPQVWISCKNNKGVDKVVKALGKIWERLKQEMDPVELDELVKNRLKKNPIYKSTVCIEVVKIRQLKAKFPTFSLRINRPKFFQESHLLYIENILREKYDLLGCPVKFIIR
ncbi:TPA: ribosome biogenesis GTPase Der [Candidatus Dependentiae bacterium]|nr:MAG: GTPase Der [candidate division TM6 bacterium GW2011_GWE2_31_21]KKP52924.1 MAG: GTPase Der [candidate division TM6 bacterium GW2011_GWF2_33_332]HBS47835.1 ribosome biogenesis GTPase Der [Candidatus Dependentiae bacterium]HBZ73189.1 ribosome biogenesis GTPase Der [Candidatus Dependentiae bacterium]